MRDAGVVAAAIEVTSHALVQHRVDGIRFDVAVFTNLSRDHLDYHETLESYFAAKARLFTPERARFAVVNRDDEFGRRLVDRAEIPTVSYSLDDARDLELGLTKSSFRLGKRAVHLHLGGEFNVSNALAAASAARALGVEPDAIVDGLDKAAGVPGRFEAIEGAGGVVAIVDYAHTPAGLEGVLRAVRAERAAADVAGKPGVIVVFGCGGDRDRGKRPVMGEVASRLADVVVLTTDNPRSEDPESIIDEIRAGMSGAARLVVEPNRQDRDRRRAARRPTRRRRRRGGEGSRDDAAVCRRDTEIRRPRGRARRVGVDRASEATTDREEGRPGTGGGGPMIAIFMAGTIALLVSGFGTPILLRSLADRRIGQQVRRDGPAIHIVKEGTPTMGGIAIIGAAAAGYLLGHVGNSAPFTWAGGFVMSALVLAGAIGFADDWLKVRRQRSLGLNKRGKIVLQLLVGVGFALAAEHWAAREHGYLVHPRERAWRAARHGVVGGLGDVHHHRRRQRGQPHRRPRRACRRVVRLHVRRPDAHRLLAVPPRADLPRPRRPSTWPSSRSRWPAPASVSSGGTRPRRKIFMGDTGSLAIGTALACLALEMNVQLLLPILGGLFVVVTFSVVIQVISFRVFHTRVFRMAPIHHHFELAGWPETTVIVRFWIFSALCTAVGLGIFYADFLGVRALL